MSEEEVVASMQRAPDAFDEKEVLARCQSRNPRQAQLAFEALVRQHRETVYALGFRFFGNHDDAAEITQRTFIRVYQRLGSFRGESKFRTWLYQIAVNLCKNFRRDEGRHKDRKEDLEGHENDLSVEVSREPAHDEEKHFLRAAVAKLSPMQRTIVTLRIYDELPFKEIAEIAGCSEASAKVNFHHALKNLKSQIHEAQGKKYDV